MVLSGAPCAVILDRRGFGGDIIISLRHVVVDVTCISLYCQRWGEGGWMHIDGTTDWIVGVEGGRVGDVNGGGLRGSNG